jgi:hypothetical protein
LQSARALTRGTAWSQCSCTGSSSIGACEGHLGPG